MHYIYKIKNTENNKVYIGRTQNPRKRFITHKSKLRLNYHPNKRLQIDYNKYGEDYFIYEIIEEVESLEEILDLEEYYVSYYRDYDLAYNIMGGGRIGLVGEEHPFYGEKRRQETKDKISEERKGKYVGEKNHMYGKSHSEETKAIMSQNRMGKATGANNGFSKKVYVNGVIYGSVKEGRESCGLKRHAFRNKLLDPNEENFRYVE